ncbi:unnamed protein product [Coregonus sp. 'balchen']|nr:unnamed protein product [Coregonus sp. 'balchen']
MEGYAWVVASPYSTMDGLWLGAAKPNLSPWRFWLVLQPTLNSTHHGRVMLVCCAQPINSHHGGFMLGASQPNSHHGGYAGVAANPNSTPWRGYAWCAAKPNFHYTREGYAGCAANPTAQPMEGYAGCTASLLLSPWEGYAGVQSNPNSHMEEEADYSSFGMDSLTRPKKTVLAAMLLRPDANRKKPPVIISLPRDFRPVSSIIDVDILPETHRRVRLYKHGQEKPLGFYIRDGSSVRVTPQGLEKVPGIFISRMVPGGLAESTGLLAVNDEVLEVNGIEVQGKSLDQVTDMMIANSHNLIVTVKPANQRNNIVRSGGGGAVSGSSGHSSDSGGSFYGYSSPGAAMATTPAHIIQNFHPEELESDEDDEDLVIEVDGEAVPSLPRYVPHLDLRTTNGALASSNSANSLSTANRGLEGRSLEEDGTVITL